MLIPRVPTHTLAGPKLQDNLATLTQKYNFLVGSRELSSGLRS